MKITNYNKNNIYYHSDHDCVIGGIITVSEFELVRGLLYLENEQYRNDNDTFSRDALHALFKGKRVAQLTAQARKRGGDGICIGVKPTIMLVGFLNTPEDPERLTGHWMPKNYKAQNYIIKIK